MSPRASAQDVPAPAGVFRDEARSHATHDNFRPSAETPAAPSAPPGAAERLRLLESAVLHSLDAIVITDAGAGTLAEPRIVFVNEAFTRLTGYTAAESLGRNPRFLQGPQTDRTAVERIRVALAAGRAVTAELINHRKDGAPIHLETHIMPIAGPDGRLAHWVGIHRDLSERKRAEAERTRFESRLREMQKLESLGLLAGGIAHDFNNLLTVILGNASLARLGPATPGELEENLRLVESAATRAADLCRQMLAYAGRGRAAVRAVDFNRLVRDTADLVRASCAKNCVLWLELSNDLPAIAGDATQLQQVVMNLLINAAEAVGAEPGRVQATTARRTLAAAELAAWPLAAELPAGDYLVLEVRDTGCGMSAETRARIFEPFFTTKFTGRGLGLATVAGIVRGHRGALDVDSTPGRGTCFRVLLPVRTAADGVTATSTPAIVAPPPPAEIPAAPDGRRRSVLVIDDELMIRETTRGVLEHERFEVLTAPDADTGLALLAVHGAPLDLVVLDLSMPGLTGDEAYDELRKVDASVPVLLMSGFSEEEGRKRLAERPLAGFVGKPFTAGQFMAAVKTAIRTRRVVDA